MPLVPWTRFTIESPLAPAESAARLAGDIEAPKWLRMGPSERLFEGQADDEAFHMHRILRYRNSFRPEIIGRIEAADSGSRIIGTMRLNAVVAVMLVIWFAGILFIIPAFISKLWATRHFEPIVIVPVVMLVFGWALVSGSFTYEARRSLAALEHVFRVR
jgi:hypothetical protein